MDGGQLRAREHGIDLPLCHGVTGWLNKIHITRCHTKNVERTQKHTCASVSSRAEAGIDEPLVHRVGYKLVRRVDRAACRLAQMLAQACSRWKLKVAKEGLGTCPLDLVPGHQRIRLQSLGSRLASEGGGERRRHGQRQRERTEGQEGG